MGWIESVLLPRRRSLCGGSNVCRMSAEVSDTKAQTPLMSWSVNVLLPLAAFPPWLVLNVTTTGWRSITPTPTLEGGAIASSISLVANSTSKPRIVRSFNTNSEEYGSASCPAGHQMCYSDGAGNSPPLHTMISRSLHRSGSAHHSQYETFHEALRAATMCSTFGCIMTRGEGIEPS